VYGEVPPAGTDPTDPLQEELQETSVGVVLTLNTAGCVSVTVCEEEQVLASVTTKVYEEAHKPVAVLEVCPPVQLYR
jgi:hypothetical protein